MTMKSERYDLAVVDAQAKQMRADILSAAFRRGLIWLLNPRAQSIPVAGRAA